MGAAHGRLPLMKTVGGGDEGFGRWDGEMSGVRLRRSDGTVFLMGKDMASQSQTIKRLMEEAGTETPITLANVSSNIFVDVIEYWKHHKQHTQSQLTQQEAESREVEYLKQKYKEPIHLVELAKVANPSFLDIKNLFDVACRAICEVMNDEIPERLFELLGIQEEEDMSDEAQPPV